MKIMSIILIISTVINWMAGNHIRNTSTSNLKRLVNPYGQFDTILYLITRIIQIVLMVIIAIKLVLIVF